MSLVIAARALLASPELWIDGGGLEIERGRITRVLASRAAVRRARSRNTLDVDGVLSAGFVNAHAHLELSGLAGRTPRGTNFRAWVRSVIEQRAARARRQLARDVRAGLERCLATGTTTIADVDSTDCAELVVEPLGPRVWLHREALDAHDARRTEPALARLRRRLPTRARRHEALAPHAPFTTSARLLEELGALARRRRLPVMVHWAETRAELDWLRDGSGPLRALLGASPRTSGLALLADAGLLQAPLSLVHGNYPERGDATRIARAGAVVVHCPGSHAWFERDPFPLALYDKHAVELALGTDSLASNEDLDMRREMRLLREAFPALAPVRVWRMATIAGARALGQLGRLGELRVDAAADCVAHRCSASTRRDALEQLTLGASPISAAWIAGRRARVSHSS